MLTALLVPLALAALITLYALLRSAARRGMLGPNPEAVVLGAVTNFFDTLGIGSFAPTMAWFKFRRLVPDRLIPCTLLPAHGLPAMAQSAIYLVLLGVLVDPALLVGLRDRLRARRRDRRAAGRPHQGLGGAAGRRLRPGRGGELLRARQSRADAGRRHGDGPARLC